MGRLKGRGWGRWVGGWVGWGGVGVQRVGLVVG